MSLSLIDARFYADEHGLHRFLVPYLAQANPELIHAESSHECLLALHKAEAWDELNVRLLGVPPHICCILARNYKTNPTKGIEPKEFDPLLQHLLLDLRGLVRSPHLADAKDFRNYVYGSLFNATKKFLATERRARKTKQIKMLGSVVEEDSAFKFSPKPYDFAAVAEYYFDLVQCCRDDLDREILKRRWLLPEGKLCMYCSDIASELNLTTDEVVAKLTKLQKRFRALINARRASRNNKDFRAVPQQPIARVDRLERYQPTIKHIAARKETRRKVRSTHPDQQPAVVPRPATPVVGGRIQCSTAA